MDTDKKRGRNSKRSSPFQKIGNSFSRFGKRFTDGSIGTKLSHFIFGAGSFSHGQIIKGLLFLSVQAGILAIMIFCPSINDTPYGWKALVNMSLMNVTEETKFDAATGVQTHPSDCTLMLLFGFVTIALIVIYFIVWNLNIASSYKADMDKKAGKKPTTFIEDVKDLLDSKFHALMLTPTCIAASVFTVLPTVFMISLAFTSYNQPDMNKVPTVLYHWNGIDNFINVFKGEGSLGAEINARFLPVLGWAFIWAIMATLTCYFGGIVLALLINKKGLKGKKIFRTIFILTIAVPQFISLLAVRNILGEWGPVNALLKNIGLIQDPILFLGQDGGSEVLAKVMVIVVNMWVGIPYTMLMTSGILMNIPTDLYEAARVDGASTLKMFRKITLPYIVFITTPYLISSFVGNIKSFNSIFLLTGGRPTYNGYEAGGTDLLVTWLYKVTIEKQSYNTGAVIGIFTFLITATITLVTYRRSRAYKEEDTFQ